MRNRITKALAVAVAVATGAVGVAACGAEDQASGGTGDGSVVRIGVSPYLEYLPWVVADKLGLPEEQGLEFQFTTFPGPTEAATAMRRGEVDMIPTCHQCNVSLYKELPELRDWMITNQYKGFMIVGRTGDVTYQEEIDKGASPKEAKETVLKNLLGKTFTIKSVTYKPLLEAALEQIGASTDDIKIVDFADDSKAALAFARGEGDYFMGSLPQEVKLLSEEDKHISLGGHEVLGPAGLWYSTMASLEGWLDENEETVNKLLAVWYRTMEYMKEQPDETLPILRDELNSRAAADFSLEDMELMTSELDWFMTLDEARENAYNPDSELFWERSADFYNAASKDELPDDFELDKYVLDTQVFERFLEQEDLVEWVKEPLD